MSDNIPQMPIPAGESPESPIEGLKRGGRRPSQKPGYMIENSVHRDEVVKIILTMDDPFNRAWIYLKDKGFVCDRRVIAGFYKNYLSKVNPEVKNSIIAKSLKEREKQARKIAKECSYTEQTKTECLIDLVRRIWVQIRTLENLHSPSPEERKLLGFYYQRIAEFRELLEQARLKSEVELARRDSAKKVAEIAVRHMVNLNMSREQVVPLAKALDDFVEYKCAISKVDAA